MSPQSDMILLTREDIARGYITDNGHKVLIEGGKVGDTVRLRWCKGEIKEPVRPNQYVNALPYIDAALKDQRITCETHFKLAEVLREADEDAESADRGV